MLEKFLSETTLDVKETINLGLFFIIERDFVGILWVENGLKSSDIKCTIN